MVLKKIDRDQKTRLILGLVCLLIFAWAASGTLLAEWSASIRKTSESFRSKQVASREEPSETTAAEELPFEVEDEVVDPANSEGSARKALSAQAIRQELKDLRERKALNDVREANQAEEEKKGNLSGSIARELKRIDQLTNEAKAKQLLGQKQIKRATAAYLKAEHSKDIALADKIEKKLPNEFLTRDQRSKKAEKPLADRTKKIDSLKVPSKEVRHRELVVALVQRIRTGSVEDRSKAGLVLRDMASKGDLSKKEDLKYIGDVLREGKNPSEAAHHFIEILAATGQAEEVVPALVFEYGHADHFLRLEIIRALGFLKHRSSESFLTKAVVGEVPSSDNIKLNAFSSLARIGTSTAKTSLDYWHNNTIVVPPPPVQHARNRAVEIAAGKVDFHAIDTGIPGGSELKLRYKGTNYHFYHPAFRKESLAKPWLFVCIHGSDLRAEELFKSCLAEAKGRNIAVLAPVFDNYSFPDYGNFDYRSTSVRSDQRFWEIVEHVSKIAGLQTREIFIFGIEKGGDFVGRLLMTQPEKFGRSAVFDAIFPRIDRKIMFPFGVKESPLLPGIEIDFPGFYKSDFLIFYKDKNARTKKSFFQSLNRKSIREGYSLRVSESIYKKKVENALKFAGQFLFKGREKSLRDHH